jgi:O-methyltransferase involved in polyketide biosynthesis
MAVDGSVPLTARIWNYLLGGTDNFPADRAVGDQILASLPALAVSARLSRQYLVRAVRFLAADAGIRQFLDIGTGLPTAENTHQVAQAVAADARIVYVDNDPLVQEQAQALLAGTRGTAYLHADLHEPERILAGAADTIDLGEPTAVLVMGVLGHVERDEDAKNLIDRLLAPLPSGSYFAMYDGGDTTEDNRAATRIWNLSAEPKYHLRSPERIEALFAGLELVEPGVVSVTRWRPEADEPVIDQFCAVGRKL